MAQRIYLFSLEVPEKNYTIKNLYQIPQVTATTALDSFCGEIWIQNLNRVNLLCKVARCDANQVIFMLWNGQCCQSMDCWHNSKANIL